MSHPTNRHVSILATGSHLPGAPIDNRDLERLCGPLAHEVLDGIQVRQRHWMIDPETGEHRTGTAAMAAAAARQALDRAGLQPGDVDLIVMSTASPDYPLPVAGTYVQEYLGLDRCAVIELRAGCVGAVQGLDLARRYLADGTYNCAVVIGAESISPMLAPLYLDQDPERVRMRDRLPIYTFGDGAGAVLLRASDTQKPAAPGYVFATQCMGGDRTPGMQIIGGGSHASAAEQMRRKRPVELRIDIPGTTRFGPQVLAAGLRDLLDRSGLEMGDLDSVVLPEGNADYFAGEFAAAGISAQDQAALQKSITENLGDVGATGSAAVPLALDDAWVKGKISPGHTVALMAIEASRYLYAGLTLPWEAPTP
ncbi:3-oxoacyl-ACP synthase III family protein [Nocardia sp. bgisy134]|uniref:3-oxoacyl-ACP synthase III family protein n=1 Tax=unclassified Nocardia TaxID=2637762 RepID=UPI003D71498F